LVKDYNNLNIIVITKRVNSNQKCTMGATVSDLSPETPISKEDQGKIKRD